MRHYLRRQSRALRFETLEARQLLAISVNTLIDEADGSIFDGDISLRDAIAAAPAGETINFAPALFNSGLAKITLTRGEVLINKSLSIVGPDAALLTIDARGNDITPLVFTGGGSRVFRIDDGAATVATVTIEGLTLTGADSAGFGGAIRSNESLTVRHAVFFHNGGFDGGAIGSAGPLSVFDSEFYDNHAQSFGGAIQIFNGGTAQIVRSSLHNNEAKGPGGAIHYLNSQAAGLTVEGSLVKNNRSESFGGGIAAQGPISVIRSSIVDNEAARDGGGIYADKGLAMSFSYVVNNIIVEVADPAQRGNGGGVFSRLYAIINDSFFRHNSAAKNGGALYFTGPGPNDLSTIQVVNSTISDNDAVLRGGGVYTEWPMLLSYSTVADNSTSTQDLSEGGSAAGGGVFFRRVTNVGNVEIDHTIVANNTRLLTPDDLGSFSNPAFPSNFNLDGALVRVTTGFNEVAAGGYTSLRGSDPKLGPLSAWGVILMGGYQRMVHALPLDSPAIDAGNPLVKPASLGVPDYDGRGQGWFRIVNSVIDIGAYESQPSQFAGDYNDNGVVDAADYVVWRNTVGSPDDLRADGSGPTFGVPDGVVDDFDRVFWKSSFGNRMFFGAGSGAAAVDVFAGAASLHDPGYETLPRTDEAESVLGMLGAGSSSVSEFESQPTVSRCNAATDIREDALLVWIAARDIDAVSRAEKDSDVRTNESAESEGDSASVDDVFDLIGTAANW